MARPRNTYRANRFNNGIRQRVVVVPRIDNRTPLFLEAMPDPVYVAIDTFHPMAIHKNGAKPRRRKPSKKYTHWPPHYVTPSKNERMARAQEVAAIRMGNVGLWFVK
jgi:hypothetical protein